MAVQGQDQTARVGFLSMGANMLLGLVKLGAGWMFSSHAMISDGLNSAGDVFASVMTLLGNRIAQKPGDGDHPWGHGKAEFVFAGVIALSMLLVAFSSFTASLEALRGLSAPLVYTPLLPAVALGTVAVKAGLYHQARQAYAKTKNLLIRANAVDHRNDIVLSLGTLVAVIAGRFGIGWVDSAIGMLIAVWIGVAGIGILRPAYRVLMDTSPEPELMAAIEAGIVRTPGVDHIDDVRVKPLGGRYLVTVKLSVDGSLTVRESHDIAGHVKAHLLELEEVQDVVVHINPV